MNKLSVIEAVEADDQLLRDLRGSIAGAYYGYDAIPERWLAAVRDRESVNSLIEDFSAVCEAR